jgi:hypothetical protein
LNLPVKEESVELLMHCNTRNNEELYAIEFWLRLSYREGLATGRPPRLAMGMAMPRDVGGWARGMAAVRRGRMARTKECEKCMSDCNS